MLHCGEAFAGYIYRPHWFSKRNALSHLSSRSDLNGQSCRPCAFPFELRDVVRVALSFTCRRSITSILFSLIIQLSQISSSDPYSRHSAQSKAAIPNMASTAYDSATESDTDDIISSSPLEDFSIVQGNSMAPRH